MKKDNPRRKRFNWKSREKVNTIIDDSEQKKIKVEISEEGSTQYDASNALVLPSAKRKTIKKRQRPPIKLLSKKHEKRLKKIVDTKEKKLQVQQLIIDLQKAQANLDDLNGLTSLQETQTLGRKVFLNPSYTKVNNTIEDQSSSELTPSHLRWKEHPSVKKARKELQSKNNKISERHLNYAVYTSSSSEDSDSDIEISTNELIMSSEEVIDVSKIVSSEENKVDLSKKEEIYEKGSVSVPCNNENKKITSNKTKKKSAIASPNVSKKCKIKYESDETTERENKVSKTKKRKLKEDCSGTEDNSNLLNFHDKKRKKCLKAMNDQVDKSSDSLKVKKKKYL